MKKRVLTGINTTGTLHIGNYVGAIRPSETAKIRTCRAFSSWQTCTP